MRKITIVFLLVGLFCHPVFSQILTGYWEGKIAITKSDSLTIGLWIDTKNDTIYAELDSPDQYFVGQKVDKVQLNDSLSFMVKSLGIRYWGISDTDSTAIRGVFSQNNRDFALVLKRGAQRKSFLRPQTPAPPFNYECRNISFLDRKGRYQLINGTLTIPSGNAPKALIIFISGSGWQDRDETLFAHKPFAVLAHNLTEAGYATFRYDDFPTAIFSKSTTYDFADGVRLILDSILAIGYLQNIERIGLLGHSEGSLVASIVASDCKNVDFTIHLGGISMPIDEILTYQIFKLNCYDTTFSDVEINNSVAISRKFYSTIKNNSEISKCAKELSAQWDIISKSLTDAEKIKYQMTDDKKFAMLNTLLSPWYFNLFHISPKTVLKKVKTPVLAISGEKDLQVPANKSIHLMKKYVKNNPNSEFHVIENLNHLLQPCTSGLPNEYPAIETTISDDVIKLIVTWLGKVTSDKSNIFK